MCLLSIKSGNGMNAFYKTLYILILQETVGKHKHFLQNNNHKAWSETGFCFDNTKDCIDALSYSTLPENWNIKVDFCIRLMPVVYVVLLSAEHTWRKAPTVPFQTYELSDVRDSLVLLWLTEVR